ncbi:hypothetical protein ACFYT3_05595 [Nocardia amikacinitolerans]|uniref:hypothetical protein n=1 Tax=Nocardia amikacinitolerans TaxID=756689 RepID=UPI0036CEB9D6
MAVLAVVLALGSKAEWNRTAPEIRSIREGIENANGIHDRLAELDPHGLERTLAR